MKFAKLEPNDIFGIYKILTPQDLLATSVEDNKLNAQKTQNYLMDALLPHDGSFVRASKVFEQVKSLLTVAVSDAVSKNNAGLGDDETASYIKSLEAQFHACIREGYLDFKEAAFGAESSAFMDYWTGAIARYDAESGVGASGKVASKRNGKFYGLWDIAWQLAGKDTNAPYPNIETACFVVKNAYCTPARRSVDQIDFFMNSIPTSIASQLVPYLDVQFETQGVTLKGKNRVIRQPSIVRFLYGSGEVANSNDNLSITAADEQMLQIVDDQAVNTASASPDAAAPDAQSNGKNFSGMEMFLMPQTLTNMDSLKANGSSKVTDSKAFLPFASLDSLNISIMNAGAGAIARKKGTLKLKIHDKSRIAEMADFLRGPQGYGRSRAKIWTTYGWLMPRGLENNSYSNFINKYMMATDCWMVMNTQFTFDHTGQCMLQLDMVTQSSNKLDSASMNADPTVTAKLKELEDIVAFIQKIKQAAGDMQNDLGGDIRPIQVLEAGAKGDFPDIHDMQRNINSLVNMIRSKGTVPESDLTKLQDDLNKLYTDKSASGKNYKQELDDVLAAGLKNMLSFAQRGPDPFLPRSAIENDLTEVGKYFAEELIAEVELALTRPLPDTRGEEKKDGGPAESGSDADKKKAFSGVIDIESPVVSFGKLFLNTVLPSLLVNCDQDEVQVIFYLLNDTCGPLSNHNVAEIPINMRKFAYAYADALATSGRDEMNVETFFNLLVNNQIASNDSIGYGMQTLYEPFDPANKEAKKIDESQFNAKISDWSAKYGSLKRPVLEMSIEVGEEMPPGDDPVSKLRRARKIKTQFGEDDLGKGPEKYSIMRIHVYDKSISPYRLVSKLIDSGNSWTLGEVNTRQLEQYARQLGEANKKLVESMTREQFYEFIKQQYATADGSGDSLEDDYLGPSSPAMKMPYDTQMSIMKGDTKAIKDYIALTVPTLRFGTNGSMISSINLASKTDGTLAAANLSAAISSAKNSKGSATPPVSGLEEASGLPLRMIPAEMTMTSLGCPIARLYQQYFVDLQTGTSIDNLYTVTQITHDIAPGKFTTNWTFMYTDGYGKFGSPPVLRDSITGAINKVFTQLTMPPATPEPASGGDGGKKNTDRNKPPKGGIQSPPGLARVDKEALPKNANSAASGVVGKPYGTQQEFTGADGKTYVAVSEAHFDNHPAGNTGPDYWHPGASIFQKK